MRIAALNAPWHEDRSAEPGGRAQAARELVASPEDLNSTQLVDRIRERGRLVLRVVGGSMGPWLVPGDLLVVQQVKPQTVRRGDVVVFLRGDLLIAHRAIKLLGADPCGELRWKTKGDSSERCDSPVCETELIGRVTFIERAGRSISLQSPAWAVAGWALAHLSPSSRLWYPIAHWARQFCSSLR